MSKNSSIEWTDHTWSPWWGCVKVSRGCKRCYAETLAKRTGFQIWGQDADRRHLSQKHWEEPYKWNEEAGRRGVKYKVFPSMCDPFERRPDLDPLRRRFWDLIATTKHLQWLLLTKRPEELVSYPRLPANAHLLATVEGNTVKARIDQLRNYRKLYHVAGRTYGLSIEPLVEPLHLTTSDLRGIDWSIVGGETGAGAEPMVPLWAQTVYWTTRQAGSKFFFKQWGDAVSPDEKKSFAHLATVREFPALLGPAVTKLEAKCQK